MTRHLAATTAGQQALARRYWTPARMERAAALRPVTASAAAGRVDPLRRSWMRALVPAVSGELPDEPLDPDTHA